MPKVTDPVGRAIFSAKRIEAFWANTIRCLDTGCLMWQGKPQDTGYGQVRVDGVQWLTHRLAWTLQNGRRPEPGKVICHTCDVRLCVEPEHLYEGTHASNRQDAMRRKRIPCGEAHWRTTLTSADVVSIRSRHATGDPIRALAREYGVHQRTVQRILRNEVWREAT